jgi:dTDP-4-amino-4,6-dideoxygalactose transaminase
MREKFLPFHVPSIGPEEISEVIDTLESGWLTTGPKTLQFEEAFRRYVGSTHAIAVNSATAALHLALEAVGVNQDDLVIVPTLTFAATAEVVCYLGAHPLFVDVHPEDFTMDPDAVGSLIQKETASGNAVKAIIPVHFAGFPCRMEKLMKVAHQHGLFVVEDAAHALPTKCDGRMIGTVGDVTAFSFYANKTITTGEGGMITTDDDRWADRMRVTRLHGMSRDAWRRYEVRRSWYYEIEALGFKYNLTDIAAAIGLHQLQKCDVFQGRRAVIAERYTRYFETLKEITLPSSTVVSVDGATANHQHAWYLYPILVETSRLQIDRDHFIEELNKRNIGVSVHFIPLHYHPYYRERFGYGRGSFPVAERFYEHCISLPIYPAMSDRDIDDVIEAVDDIVTRFRR